MALQAPSYCRKCCGSIERQSGYILLPVVLAITLVATIAFMLNNESALGINILRGELEAAQARYVAAAGLNHALWQVGQDACGPYSDITDEPFGNHSYSATIADNGDGGTATFVVPVSANAWLKQETADQVYGAQSQFTLKNHSTNAELIVYRYDIANAGIPAGATVTSAIARFWVITPDDSGPINIHPVTTDWTEADASWNSVAGNYESGAVGSLPVPSGGTEWAETNVTALAQGWVNGSVANQGIILVPSSNNKTSEYTGRSYGNTALVPVLEVTVSSGTIATRADINATGILANGTSRGISRTNITLFQPPSNIAWQPGAALQDAFIWDGAHKNKNFGVSPILNIKNDRNVLIRFALEALPPGARIKDAKLGLYLEGGSGVTDGVLDLHAVSRAWIEGRYDDVDPDFLQQGVTYEEYDGHNAWTTSGGDYDPRVIDSITLPAMVPGWYEWNVTEQIQAWLDGQPNYGFLLREGGGDAGDIDFTSSDNTTNPENHPRLTLTFACECGIACQIPQGSGKVSMIVDYVGFSLSSADQDKKAVLESWGYEVDAADDNFLWLANFSNYDVVYVSESASSDAVGTQLTNLSIGVVSEQGNLNDELEIADGMASSAGASLNVVDSSHYITALFPSGMLPVYSANMEVLMVSGIEAPALQTLADFGGSGSLVALDQGMQTTGGGVAAGRRATLPLGSSTITNFNWNYLNNNGRLMVQRALQWGTGTGCSDGNFRDEFGSNAFDNSDGRLDWSGDWIEVDASGSGTDDGRLRILSGEARLKGTPSGDSPSLTREMDLSAYQSATLSFDFRTGSGVEAGEDGAVAEVSDDGGSNWVVLEDFIDVGPSASGSRSHDITAYIATNTQVRFRVNVLYGGSNEYFYVDNVDIAASCDPPPTFTPLAHWKLDDGSGPLAVDSIGGHDGALTGSTWTAGHLDGALSFDDANDSMIIPDDPFWSLDPAMNRSWVMWINPDDLSTEWNSIWAQTNASGRGIGIVAHTTSNADMGPVTNGISVGWDESASDKVGLHSMDNVLTEGAWHHVVVTHDGTLAQADRFTIYVDGVDLTDRGDVDSSGSLAAMDTSSTAIGSNPVDPGYGFGGDIDDVRVYDQVLSMTEIAALASEGGGGGGGASSRNPAGGVIFEEFTETSLGSNRKSLDIAKPGGTVAGDLLITAIVTDGKQGDGGISPPAGWTLINQGYHNERVTLGVWWKIAGTGEPAQYRFTWPEDQNAYGWVMRFTGHDALNPINVSAKRGGKSTDPTSPAVTTTLPNTMILRIGGFDDDDIDVDEPGLTDHTAITMDESDSGDGTSSGGAGYLTQATAGDSGTSTFSLTNYEEYRTVTIAIAPDPGG